MLKLLDNIDIPYDKGPFYAVIFSVAVLILFVAFSRRKNDKEEFEDDVDIQYYDVLSQPVSPPQLDQFPEEGVLFNTGSKTGIFKSFLMTLAVAIIFGIIVLLFY